MTRNYSKILLEISGRTRYDYGAMVSGEVHLFLCKELEKLAPLRREKQCSISRPIQYYEVKESE